MILTANDYEALYNIVFRDGYPGYRPNIVESPDGNGIWDTEKKFAHIARKYLDKMPESANKAFLQNILRMALIEAQEIAKAIGIPDQYLPHEQDSTIRVLYYPPMAGTAPHRDFDLFTTILFRDKPHCFNYLQDAPSTSIQCLSEQIHFGELAELINPEFKATYHEVIPWIQSQRSIVFFAMPNWDAILPTGQMVGEWMEERISRSRKEV